MRSIISLLLVCSALLLGACGQKGPLTLPDEAQGEQTGQQQQAN